jgi:hypothetical protein
MPTCPNLRELFGDHYRIGHDPVAVTPTARKDPWLMTLPCQRGTIYPFGLDRLAVEVGGRPDTANRLAAIPGVRLHQEGDRERTFVFPAVRPSGPAGQAQAEAATDPETEGGERPTLGSLAEKACSTERWREARTIAESQRNLLWPE